MTNSVIKKNRKVFFVNSIFANLYIFFSLPLLTTSLSKNDFAVYSLLSQFAVISSLVLVNFFSRGLLKFWNDLDSQQRKKMLGTIFNSLIFFIIFFDILFFFNGNFLLNKIYPVLVDISDDLILLITFWFSILAIKSFFFSFIKVLENPKLLLIYNLILFLSLLISFLYLYIQNDISLNNVIFIFSISEFLPALIVFLILRKYISLYFSFDLFKMFFRFSLSLIGASFIFIFFVNADKVILARNYDLDIIANYSVALTLSAALGILLTINWSAYGPRLKKEFSIGNFDLAKKTLNYYFHEILFQLITFLLFMVFFLKFVFAILAPLYYEHITIFFFLILCSVHIFRFPTLVCEQILFNFDRNHSIFLYKLLLFLIFLVIVYPLMKIINFYAIPLSYVFAYILLFIFMYSDVKKYTFLIIDIKKFLIPFIFLLFFLLLEVINIYINVDTFFWTIEAIQFTIIVISCFLYYFWFFKVSE